jgi:hypothetical protein
MDWRILLLDFGSRHSLLLSTFYVVLIVSVGSVAIALEYRQTCKEVDLRLWLILVLIRLVLRLGLRLYIEAIVHHLFIYRGNILVFHKLIDLIDLFGIVWFAVGNLLLFNNTICLLSVPWTFGASLAYILATYALLSIPVLLKCSLGT